MEKRYPYVHVDVNADESDEVSSTLFDLGAEGVEERDASTLFKNATEGKVTLVASFGSKEDADAAIAELSSYKPRYEEIIGDAWRDAWKEYFKPFAVAPGLVVRPPWEPYEAKEGEKVLELEPGRAFGTGLHETTRLVARAIAAHGVAGKPVLDVGCGSGILSFVALILGASSARAIDIDPDSVDVTRENAERNSLTIETSTDPIESIEGTYPVVLANIEARILIPMAPDLSARVAPGGLLLLSGILVPQKDDVIAAYPGFDLLESPSLGEWILLSLRKK